MQSSNCRYFVYVLHKCTPYYMFKARAVENFNVFDSRLVTRWSLVESLTHHKSEEKRLSLGPLEHTKTKTDNPELH